MDELEKKYLIFKRTEAMLLQKISSQSAKAKKDLLKNLNPIIKKYMQEKKFEW